MYMCPPDADCDECGNIVGPIEAGSCNSGSMTLGTADNPDMTPLHKIWVNCGVSSGMYQLL
jgi:hypothetical protein